MSWSALRCSSSAVLTCPLAPVTRLMPAAAVPIAAVTPVATVVVSATTGAIPWINACRAPSPVVWAVATIGARMLASPSCKRVLNSWSAPPTASAIGLTKLMRASSPDASAPRIVSMACGMFSPSQSLKALSPGWMTAHAMRKVGPISLAKAFQVLSAVCTPAGKSPANHACKPSRTGSSAFQALMAASAIVSHISCSWAPRDAACSRMPMKSVCHASTNAPVASATAASGGAIAPMVIPSAPRPAPTMAAVPPSVSTAASTPAMAATAVMASGPRAIKPFTMSLRLSTTGLMAGASALPISTASVWMLEDNCLTEPQRLSSRSCIAWAAVRALPCASMSAPMPPVAYWFAITMAPSMARRENSVCVASASCWGVRRARPSDRIRATSTKGLTLPAASTN